MKGRRIAVTENGKAVLVEKATVADDLKGPGKKEAEPKKKELAKTEMTTAARDVERIPYAGRLAIMGMVLTSMAYDDAVKEKGEFDDFPVVKQWNEDNDTGKINAIIEWPKSKKTVKFVFDAHEVARAMSMAWTHKAGHLTRLVDFKTKGEKLDHIIVTALARLELAKQRLEAFKFATGSLSERTGNKPPGFDEHYGAIYAAIHMEITRAYENLFMWGNLFGDEMQSFAKRIALREMLAEEDGIMYYMSSDGSYMGGYRTEDEEQLRKEIAKLTDDRKRRRQNGHVVAEDWDLK
jgi:hypothetical protein